MNPNAGTDTDDVNDEVLIYNGQVTEVADTLEVLTCKRRTGREG